MERSVKTGSGADAGGGGLRRHRGVIGVSALLLITTIFLVALSLRRDPPAAYPPTAEGPGPAADSLIGPVRVTLDASDPVRWVFYDFSRGRWSGDPEPRQWDLAFRRFHVAANGGPGFAGDAGVVDLGPVPFDSVDGLPAAGYVTSDASRDSTNPAIARWYDYGFTSHLLTPKPRVYAIRTADGHYAKLRFLSYYCPGARPGCITFEYVYQGDGSRAVR